MITLEQAVELVWHSLEDMVGGEIYVKKIPSMNIMDIAEVVSPSAKKKIVGIRPGEKLHEQMIGFEDSQFTFEYDHYYKILPAINEWFKSTERIKNGKKVPVNFSYVSDKNSDWMKKNQLTDWINKNLINEIDN